MANFFDYHTSDVIKLKLSDFEGPLDLLYSLIKESKLDIMTCRLSEVTGQYLAYMDQIGEVDMDVASDFLVMAATLLDIKAKSLLPQLDLDEQDDFGEYDPEEDLRRQLILFKMFKDEADEMRKTEVINQFYPQPQFTEDDAEIVVKSFPVYGERGARDVILHLPGGLLIASSETVRFRNPLNSESVMILLDNGKAFPHAHVWDNGMPCWNDNSVKSLGELFTTFVNTLMWMNISKDSRDYGHFTKCVCTDTLVKKGVWKEVDRQRAAVSRAVGFEVGSKDPLAFYGSAYKQLLAISMR